MIRMSRLLVVILAVGLVTAAWAQVELSVYEADGETPFDCNEEIMVGTKLVLVVSSDSNDYWSGGLFISGQDRLLGMLSGRDCDPNVCDPNSCNLTIKDCNSSHYEAAGECAVVFPWQDSLIWGYDMYTYYPVDGNSDNNSTVPGDWFVIDYEANDVGDCNMEFYDYTSSWDEPSLVVTLSQVPTRDLNWDEKVDFADYAEFASSWEVNDCNGPDWCYGADLDRDGDVDYDDLGLFSEYWLWPSEPNDSNGPQSTVAYSVVDGNGLSEITIDVNESITLYVDMEVNDYDVYTFSLEVDISDPNLGSIDNTEYDSNDPPGPGTARILASPRTDSFDYWGPGWQQEEGIYFSAGSLGQTMNDGHIASFVFTCEGEGDVTLEIVNWDGKPVVLGSITIHQNNSN